MPELGDLIQHDSGTKYWYLAVHPDTGRHVVALKGGTGAYTISDKELDLYYTVIDPNAFEVGKKYKSSASGSVFLVEAIFTNPKDDTKAAHGWYWYADGLMNIPSPHYIMDFDFHRWSPID